jgi:aminoglycoside phosphotransferase (APT) family kinase protein
MSSEALTKSAVTELLRARLDPALECAGLERGPLGNAQETWFVHAVGAGRDERRLVLRRSAAAGTLEHTDRALEFELLGALAAQAFPVPRVHWLETEPSALGRPYFVMDRLPGAPPGRLGAAEAHAVARQLGAWLARLHALPAGALPEPAAPVTASGATRAELRAWAERYARTGARVPAIGALLGWLDAHVPAGDGPARVLWGDPGPHNLLVEGDRVTGLLDWELSHAGDPLEDLGAALWAAPTGGLDPAEVIAGYEAQAGPVPRDALRFFEVMACVDRSIMLLAGVAAYLDGGGRPSSAALGQQLLLSSLLRAAALAGWGEAPAATPPPARVPDPVRLRPDAAETTAGVARFLRDDVLPAVDDGRLRREIKTAAALLDTAALRSAAEEPAGRDLEDAAARAERGRTRERAGLRALLLEDLAAQRALIAPLDDLLAPTRR